MDKTSIHICNLLRDEKKQSELFIGSTQYYWDYMLIPYTADCTEALPLTLMDKTICGVLDIDGALTAAQLGAILGLNVVDEPENCEYRDAAEASILDRAIRSLLDFGMISRDFTDGAIRLTDIGHEYYRQGKKFRTIQAHSFDVYFDRTTGVHGKARKIFAGKLGRSVSAVTPSSFKDEQYLKAFIHEQIPSIYDPEKGNSFTNISCPSLTKLIKVPVQIGVLYDVISKDFRYIAILEDKICPELCDIIASNEKIREELSIQVRIILHGALRIVDRPSQESFEASLQEGVRVSEESEGISKLVPAVMEQEEFWQGLPLLVGEKETEVFIKAENIDVDECKTIISLCESHPSTNIFLSYNNCEVDIPFKHNLFHICQEVDGDYILCTPSVTYALRGYVLNQSDDEVMANMVFRYADTEIDSAVQRGPFAIALLPKMITDTMNYLDTDFDISKRSVRSISHCDSRINVFQDFLYEESLAQVRTKKQEVFNRVKIEFEKTLLDKLVSIVGEKDLDDINKIKELEEIALRVDAIMNEGDETYINLMESGRAFKQSLKERERTIKDELLAKTFIIDTNVFLDDPEILSKFKRPNRVVLSGQVLQELDKKKNKAEDPATAANARKAVGAINAAKEKDKKAKKKFLLFDYADMSLLPEELQTKKGDNFILGVAMKYRDANPWMLTSDNILGLTAESLGIPTVTLDDFYVKNGLTPPPKPGESTKDSTPKTYMDVYNKLYDLKGFVILSKLERECQRYGIKAESLGYSSFLELIEADPELTLSTNAKGVTYVNRKR